MSIQRKEHVKLSQEVTAWELESKRYGATVVCEWVKHWDNFMLPLSIVKLKASSGETVLTLLVTTDERNRLCAKVERSSIPAMARLAHHKTTVSGLVGAFYEFSREAGIEWEDAW
jgi:hypothetical protein